MASNNIFQKAEDWLDDLETVGTYAAEKIGSVTKDMPIVKSLGAIAANPTRQEIGAQVSNLASATNKGLQESFGGDPVDMALNYGPGAMAGIISPKLAKTIKTAIKLPQDDIFKKAVENTPTAKITPDGLQINIERFQKIEQAGEPSVRTGVFYLPEGSQQAKHYKTGKYGYGGGEKISGETLVKAPLFVKGATGGKAPEAAYDLLSGKGAYQKMRSDVLSAIPWQGGGDKTANISQVLEKYGVDPVEAYDIADNIVRNSKQGNTLPYATQEAIVAYKVRESGYDSVIGFSTKKDKTPFISELFDVREANYPIQGEEGILNSFFGTAEDFLDQ